MTSTDEPGRTPTCTSCAVIVQLCAFCERGDCPEAICYRCLREDLGESIPELHPHGG